jgi:hypothetical protein
MCWVSTVAGVVSFLRWLNKGNIDNVEDRYIFVTGCDTGGWLNYTMV